MTLSIWRYSHLALAISSSFFLCIASVTGIILAFEPISDSINSYAIKENKNISLAEAITTLEKSYNEVISFEIDTNDALTAYVITKDGNSETIFVDPLTGKKLGKPIEKAPIFKFATNLHRSLFLKSTGRFFVGFASLLLIIITVTGIFLILKRQGNIKHFFSKIEKEYFAQYYHVIFGRLFLLPILIVAITGLYLSLEKFSVVPKSNISHQIDTENFISSPKIPLRDFEVFKTIHLDNVRAVEFPFSDDIEDYFLVKLTNRELLVNQFTGAIISQKQYPFVALASYWSIVLHTGQGNILWSIILLITSCSILFFIYSGFTMTIKRLNRSKLSSFNHKKDEAEYIILVGSETGSTFTFANLFTNALSIVGKTVFISELNKYTHYQKAKHLIIFTSTYGVGEPPANAKKFEHLFNTIVPVNKLHYSIVGLGSLAYPHFCKYALDIDKLLGSNSQFESFLEPYKINNQSFTAFKDWVSAWSTKTGIPLGALAPPKKKKSKNELFTVIERSNLNKDDTFILRLRAQNEERFKSGDLLAFYPEEDDVERLYSIGKIDNDILLAIKKHELGICSNYLSKLNAADVIKASIKQYSDFNFPDSEKEVIMISNGTGIAPFLGMILSDKSIAKTHFFWGGRTKASIKIYDDLITRGVLTKKIASLHLAYSQEQKEKVYVQDLIQKESKLIIKILKNKGTIMICGSIAMQKEVIGVLEIISETKLGLPLAHFQQTNQIKIDCY